MAQIKLNENIDEKLKNHEDMQILRKLIRHNH